MVVGHARDLRQVRDRQHLRPLGEPLQRVGDRVRRRAADAGVDLVEHHRQPAGHGRDRERDARELAAGGGLGDRPERHPRVRADQEGDLVRAGRARLPLAELGPELALAHPDAAELGGDGVRERLGPAGTGGAQLVGQPPHAFLGGRERLRCGGGGIVALRERAELGAGLAGAGEQLLVGRAAEAPLRVGDALELRLDVLDPIRVGFEREQEGPQVGAELPQAQLQVAQLLTRACELGRDSLERRNRPLGDSGQRRRAVAVLGRERLGGRRGALGELGHVAQPVAIGVERCLGVRLEPLGRRHERLQLGEPGRLRRCVARQLLVAPAGRTELAPRRARLPAPASLLLAAEGVEHVELVRGPRQPALLELTGHGDEPLGGCGQILPRHRPAPGVRPRAPVGEDAAREHEPGLVLRGELRETGQLVVVEEAVGHVELGLDVRLGATGADGCRVALLAEQQAERVREDRLPRSRLARDRVQPLRGRELRGPDQHEVLDAQATKQRSGCSG